MRRIGVFLSTVIALTAGLGYAQNAASGAAGASKESEEIERLRKIILEEQEVIAGCMKRIDALEQTKTAQDKAGLNSIKLNGDFRYRYDYIHQDPDNGMLAGVRGLLGAPQTPDTRARHRLRLRLGFEWVINEQISAIGRAATTMNADNVSYNQTLDDAFAKKDLWLDLAYFDYHPTKVPGLKAMGGKMNNPFYTPGKTQMIWDQDLTPEGLALTYTNTMEASPTGPVFREVPWEFGLAAGYFMVDERALDVDAVLYGFQGTVKRNFVADGSTSLMLGLSYFDFQNVEGYPPLFSATDNFGNALSRAILNGTALYEDDFNIVEAFTEFTTPVWNRPLSLYGDLALNTASIGKEFDDGNGGLGWALGLTYGRCATPNSWALKYEYRYLERDAVVGAFTDSDFGGGGTNAKGHILGVEYMPLKNTRLNVTYFINDTMGSDWLRLLPVFGGRENVDGPYQRLQVDFNLKF